MKTNMQYVFTNARKSNTEHMNLKILNFIAAYMSGEKAGGGVLDCFLFRDAAMTSRLLAFGWM